MQKIKTSLLVVVLLTAMSGGFWQSEALMSGSAQGLLMFVAMRVTFGLPDGIARTRLAVPTNLTCGITDNSIKTDWDEVAKAHKYIVSIVAMYRTTRHDGHVVRKTVTYTFVTGNRTDDRQGRQSDLSIPVQLLNLDTDGDGHGDLRPREVDVRVKALATTSNRKDRNSHFSARCPVV